MTPAAELRSLRSRLGMTQAELAAAVGVEGSKEVRQVALARWERGTHKVPGSVLMLVREMVRLKEQVRAKSAEPRTPG